MNSYFDRILNLLSNNWDYLGLQDPEAHLEWMKFKGYCREEDLACVTGFLHRYRQKLPDSFFTHITRLLKEAALYVGEPK